MRLERRDAFNAHTLILYRSSMTRTFDIAACVKETFHVRNDLKQLRAQRKLSQADLAAALGVSRQTVNAIENDRYDPSLPLALALSRLFARPIEEIFHDDPTPTDY